MSTQSVPLDNLVPATPSRSIRARILRPSLTDLFFLSVLWWSFFAGENGWVRLLMDASTGIHIRAGEYILATHQVPRTDPFSFTVPGKTWYAFEWLSEALFGAIHTAWGLKGVVILAGLVLATTLTIVFWSMLSRGANPWIAVLLTLLCVTGTNVGFFARPHIFTYLLLAITAEMVARDRIKHSRAIWFLVPLTVLWTNLHGGFFILFPFLGILVAGAALEAYIGDRTFADAKRYTILTAACVAASVLNPYGLALHEHVLFTVTDNWTASFVSEFKSPSFHNDLLLAYMTVLFLGLGAGALLLTRRRLTEALWIAFFAYASLSAARHVPLFLIVAAPIVAVELTSRWSSWVVRQPRKSAARILDDIGTPLAAGGTYISLCLPGMALVFFLTCSSWPTAFPDEIFPAKIAAHHADLIATSRLYTSDQWADYLIYQNYPHQRVFMDDRHQFYGPKIGNDYLTLDSGAPGWRKVLDQYKVDTVLAKASSPLVSILRERQDWRVVEEDKVGVLFARRP